MTTNELPGEQLDMEKMPGHWALARRGKRVLRPGGDGMVSTNNCLVPSNLESGVIQQIEEDLGRAARVGVMIWA